MCLSAVLDNVKSKVPGYRCDTLDITTLAVEVNGNDGPRAWADGSVEGFQVDRAGLGFDVAEDRCCARTLDRGNRGDARVRLGDDFVARPDVKRTQGELDRIRTGTHADCMLGATGSGELTLERRPFATQYVPATVENAAEGSIEVVANERGGPS
jgi:hypothetical protein